MLGKKLSNRITTHNQNYSNTINKANGKQIKVNKHGKCCICGREGMLTQEHIPPSAAFNEYPMLIQELWQLPKTGKASPTARRKPSGNASYTLFASWNSFTRGEYGSEYVKFIKEIAECAETADEGKVFHLTFSNIMPLRILKQVLSLICSTCGPEFVQTYSFSEPYLK